MDTFDAERSGIAQPQRPKAGKSRRSFNSLQWIGMLDRLEAGARNLFLGMAALSFVAYGYMVYTQDQWQSHHRQLQKLRNQESQQAIINARIRNQAAELAEKDTSGTVDPLPSQAVFVQIDSQAPLSRPALPTPPPAEISATVGY